MDLDALGWDAAGLLTVVAQDRLSGEVRMVAHANREALELTLRTRQAHFFSRSRGRLWRKGETSGHVLHVREVWADCDGDAVLYLVDPEGPSCHTGAETCFFTRLEGQAGEGAAIPATSPGDARDASAAAPLMLRLWKVMESRRAATGARSYTRKLLDGGPAAVAAKVREESDELGRALEGEADARVVAEAADVVYHTLVGLLARGVRWSDVEAELARRFGVSGHDEKAARGRSR